MSEHRNAAAGRSVLGIVAGRQFGDRHAFLARAEVRAAAGPPHNVAHPIMADGAPVRVVSSLLDRSDLVGSFVANARALGVVVHENGPDDEALRSIIETHGVHRVVHSLPEAAVEAGQRMAMLGAHVEP